MNINKINKDIADLIDDLDNNIYTRTQALAELDITEYEYKEACKQIKGECYSSGETNKYYI